MNDRPAWMLRAEQTLRDRCQKPTGLCVGCGEDYRMFAHYWMGEDRNQQGPFCTKCWRKHEGRSESKEVAGGVEDSGIGGAVDNTDGSAEEHKTLGDRGAVDAQRDRPRGVHMGKGHGKGRKARRVPAR